MPVPWDGQEQNGDGEGAAVGAKRSLPPWLHPYGRHQSMAQNVEPPQNDHAPLPQHDEPPRPVATTTVPRPFATPLDELRNASPSAIELSEYQIPARTNSMSSWTEGSESPRQPRRSEGWHRPMTSDGISLMTRPKTKRRLSEDRHRRISRLQLPPSTDTTPTSRNFGDVPPHLGTAASSEIEEFLQSLGGNEQNPGAYFRSTQYFDCSGGPSMDRSESPPEYEREAETRNATDLAAAAAAGGQQSGSQAPPQSPVEDNNEARFWRASDRDRFSRPGRISMQSDLQYAASEANLHQPNLGYPHSARHDQDEGDSRYLGGRREYHSSVESLGSAPSLHARAPVQPKYERVLGLVVDPPRRSGEVDPKGLRKRLPSLRPFRAPSPPAWDRVTEMPRPSISLLRPGLLPSTSKSPKPVRASSPNNSHLQSADYLPAMMDALDDDQPKAGRRWLRRSSVVGANKKGTTSMDAPIPH
ncbi:unnamed protein product [Parajaminaea phylloscopi]